MLKQFKSGTLAAMIVSREEYDLLRSSENDWYYLLYDRDRGLDNDHCNRPSRDLGTMTAIP